MKYFHNQKVKCEIGGIKIEDAKISINKKGTPYICQNEKNGISTENKIGYRYSWELDNNFSNEFVTHLRPALKSFNNPEVGDEYKNKSGISFCVMGICGRCIFLSEYGDKNVMGDYYTKEELIQLRYTIVQDDQPKEMTKEEIEKELGHKVKIND